PAPRPLLTEGNLEDLVGAGQEEDQREHRAREPDRSRAIEAAGLTGIGVGHRARWYAGDAGRAITAVGSRRPVEDSLPPAEDTRRFAGDSLPPGEDNHHPAEGSPAEDTRPAEDNRRPGADTPAAAGEPGRSSRRAHRAGSARPTRPRRGRSAPPARPT